jgi:hypothetical protein
MKPLMDARLDLWVVFVWDFWRWKLDRVHPFMTARAQAYEYVQEYHKAIACIEAFNASLMPGDMTTVTPLRPKP